MMKKRDHVQTHTATHVNREIERQAARHLVRTAGQSPTAVTRRINELDDEWDIERWLEMNASALAFTGVVLGIFVNKNSLPFLVSFCRSYSNTRSRVGARRFHFSAVAVCAPGTKSTPKSLL
jgi:hypothetical protein